MELERAIILATEAHRGKYNHISGELYILHPLHVMSKMTTVFEKTIAILHDVLEDTDYTPGMLLDAGISRGVIDVVNILTRDGEETYIDYITSIGSERNKHAIKVKIADIKHNMDISRISRFDPVKDVERIARYAKALAYLTRQIAFAQYKY